MALASLCSKSREFLPLSFTAYVVDHCARPGSTDEAEYVVASLKRMGKHSE